MALLLVVNATGCVGTFASLDPEQRFDLRGRPSVYVAVTSEMARLDNANQRAPVFFEPDYTDDVVDALHACDCFAAVHTTPGSHDLEASVRVRRLVHSKTALLNLATAMVVPGVEDRRLFVLAVVRDPSSNAEARAERSREFRVWYQLFLLAIYPFVSPAAFESNLLSQLVRETVTEAIDRIPAPAAERGAAAEPTSP